MPGYVALQDVGCGYGPAFQIQQITFTLEKGMFAGIIGPNGSGKTTLFRGITGELPLKMGKVLLSRDDLHSLRLKEKARRMAVVNQFTDSIDITVEDYVLMGRMPYRKPFQFFETKEDIDIAHEYMQLTDVFALRKKLMSELSGGEQQLAAIARALAQQPELLLLDEPTSHLDIMHQVQILNLIQKLGHNMGITVLMIIHDLNLAGEYCDFLVMMDNGKMHIKGTPNEVLTYQNIEDVYKTVVITQTNPLSKRPAVFLVSDKILKRGEGGGGQSECGIEF
jgi:iron complex transport system ATP-binding protein